MRRLVTMVLGLGTAALAAAQPADIKVLAAGSLRAVLSEVARAWEA
jgi:ABC-type molybdate transport system substrate-binding protein